jgi:hypothetical protein
MTDASFCEQLLHEKEQHDIKQLYNVPLARFTPGNPYSSGKFTQMQLDMRRKVEILKYRANKSSTQTNNLTKNQKFALLARGSIPSRSQTANNTKCEKDKLIPRPTSSSGVPGPVTYLYEDSAVPLYNYSGFNTRTYPDYIPNNLDPWQFVIIPNALAYASNSAISYYLIINNNIDNSRYNYTVTTPIGVTIEGIIPPSDFSGNYTVSLSNADISVYYNSSKVGKISASNISNFNMKIEIPENTGSTSKSFSVTQFLGNLVFTHIRLFTEPSYVYKFVLTVEVSISTDVDVVYTSIRTIANITRPNSIEGCTMISHTGTVNAGASITT